MKYLILCFPLIILALLEFKKSMKRIKKQIDDEEKRMENNERMSM